MIPYRLAPNAIEHFYLGGERIAALRGTLAPARAATTAEPPMHRPEEWLASTVARWGSPDVGPTELDQLGPLAELIAADPEHWLGPDHAARWGASPALLVKLLDAGQRLPVHVHPRRRFAEQHLACPFGKTEAWVVLDVPPGGGTAYLGTTRPVRREDWGELVAAQATDELLSLLHPLRIQRGDGVVVPSGTPHCLDAGVFVVELQEPTDFSVLLEWEGFDIDGAADGHLGLGFDVALDAVRNDAVSTAELDRLVRRAGSLDQAPPGQPRRLLPESADPYFRAWAVDGGADTSVPPAFSVVVVTDGAGSLRSAGGDLALERGDALVAPYAAGPLTFSAGVTAIVAQSPAPDTADPVEDAG